MFDPSFKHLLLVGLGGFMGSVARYVLGGWALQAAATDRFPTGTFVVNLSGCLLVGVLAGLVERHAVWGAGTRLFLFTGLLGGFTTFSAFGLETVGLMRRGELVLAATYACATVLLGVAAVWIGMRLAMQVAR